MKPRRPQRSRLRTSLLRGGMLSAVIGAVIGSTDPAFAATGGRIAQVTTASGQINVIFAATGLTAGQAVDPATVTMTLNGHPTPATATHVLLGTVHRVAVLAIDTSGSMAGVGIAGARSAAINFLDGVPADVSVGLVTFADQPTLRVAPTTDRARVRTAVAQLGAAGETTLYDGIALAIAQAGGSGARSVLVLSDGADTQSKLRLSGVLAQLRATGSTLDAVAFRTNDSDTSVLGQLPSAGHGRVIAAGGTRDIGAAFTAAAQSLSSEVLVTAAVPAALGGKDVSVGVNATAGGVAIHDEVLTHLAPTPSGQLPPVVSGPVAVAVDSGFFSRHGALLLGLLGLFLGLAVLLAVALGGTRSPDKSRVRRRLSFYTLTGRVKPEREEVSALGDSSVARSAVEFAGRVVASRDLESTLERQLEQAGVPLRPAEWLLIHIGAGIGLAFLFLLISGGTLVATVLGLVLGLVGPMLFLAIKTSARERAFLSQMPDTLQVMASSLQAGYSLPQAVDAVVREGTKPIAAEFQRALVESRLGVPIEDGLDAVGVRMESRDFAWVVMAIRIQRDVGGNLSEVLSNVAGTMRERDRLRRQARVLSAEGRLSAFILGGLPPLFGLYLALVRPDYLHPLFHEPIGLLMVGFGGALFITGLFWLRKVVTVEL